MATYLSGEHAHSDGVWDMRRITQTPFYALDRGARNETHYPRK